MNNRTVIYCRVSDPHQVKEGNSLVSQERICREYALAKSLIVVEAFIEKGQSAKDTNRPEFKKLLKYCFDKKNQVGSVLVYKVDRIARKKYDYQGIKIYLRKKGIDIFSATENFDSSPSGKFMESVLADVAQFDNDMRAERCVTGMKQAMLEGRYVWAAPLGYENIRITGKGTIAKSKIAPFILETFELVAQNPSSIEEARKQMQKNGLTNNQGKYLSRAQFYRLLKNQVYVGWIVKFGERLKGNFDPIVSQEIFDQVQRVLKHRKRRNISYLLQNPDFPLRRFVSNLNGLKLTGSWSKGRTNYYPYYRFKLPGQEFKKELIEKAFMDFIDGFQFDKEKLKKFSVFLKNNLIHSTKEQQKDTVQLKQHIATMKDRQHMLIQKNLQGVISNELLRENLDKIDFELMEKNASLARMPNKETNLEELFKFSINYLEKPSVVWTAANLQGKLKLQWFHFPQGIVFDGKKFGTKKIHSLFKAKKFFFTNQSLNADTMHNTSNHQVSSKPTHKASFLPPKPDVQSINEEIIELGKIVRDANKEPPEPDMVLSPHY